MLLGVILAIIFMFWIQNRIKTREKKRKEQSINSELMLEKQKEDQVFMMKLYDWMTIHYMEHKLDVNEILTELEMNLADFEDNIKRITGMTPKEYIYDFRLSKARDLLVNTNDSLEDIARIIGFKTMGKFEMLFQHKTGMTPQEYRDKYTESNDNTSGEN
jgi:transcriptional regulator GlxA family with amidase domain